MQPRSQVGNRAAGCAAGAVAALFLSSAPLSAETLPLPKAGLRIDYQTTIEVVGEETRRVTGAYHMLVTCVRGPYVATFRIHRGGKQKTTSRLVSYRNVTPASVLITLPRGRTLKQRFIFLKAPIDAFLKAGGRKGFSFAVGDTATAARDPIRAVRSASTVTVQALRRETVNVPAGRFDTVVLNTRTVWKPPAGPIAKVVTDATGWFARDLGYPVRMEIRQTYTGKVRQKVSQSYQAAKVSRESPPKDGCNDVPEK